MANQCTTPGGCRDVNRLCEACRLEFENLLDELHQEAIADEEAASVGRCLASLPWQRDPCPNTANPADPDGYCSECRGAIDDLDNIHPEGGL